MSACAHRARLRGAARSIGRASWQLAATGGRRSSALRRAFSLIEVLLATSILMGSLIVLEELARLGRRHAVAAEELATAQAVARTRMGEILAGAAPLKTTEAEQVLDAPGWVCNVRVEPVSSMNLSQIIVTVAKGDALTGGSGGSAGGNSNGASAGDGQASRTAAKGRSFTLIQWIRTLKRGQSNGPSTPSLPQVAGRFAAGDGR